MEFLYATPCMKHAKSTEYESVYEPAEDSFLMLDALEKEHEELKIRRPRLCMEVGCGSGICITFLAQLLGPTASYFCTDVNPKAAQLTLKTGAQNKVIIQPVISDLANVFADRLKGHVDVLIFNPPYVVTPSSEVGSGGIEASWAGGEKGREVLDRFLSQVSHLLSPSGLFYLVVIKENMPEEIEDILKVDGLKMTPVISRKAGPEHLSVLKFTRS